MASTLPRGLFQIKADWSRHTHLCARSDPHDSVHGEWSIAFFHINLPESLLYQDSSFKREIKLLVFPGSNCGRDN